MQQRLSASLSFSKGSGGVGKADLFITSIDVQLSNHVRISPAYPQLYRMAL